MLNTPLWQCPICCFDAKEPAALCERCGCNLLLLVKIKTEAQLAIIRAEEARGRLLGALISVEQPVQKPLKWFEKIRFLFSR